MPAKFAQMGKLPTLTFEYRFEAPDRISLVRQDGAERVSFVQDGKQLCSELPTMNAYVLREAMPVAELGSEDGKKLMQAPGAEIVLGLGLEAGAPAALRGYTELSLIGREPVDGVDCYRLAGKWTGYEGEIWIAEGDRPWVVRVHLPPPEQTPAEGGRMVIRPGVDLRLENWSDEPDLEGVFTIDPPDGMEKFTAMPSAEEIMRMSAANRGGGAGRSGQGKHPSAGKPAPAVQLQPLEGEPIDLASLKGKVVVLDFWATWCRPCVIALPLVTKVANEFADRGVVFYAVNQRESRSKVKAFLARHELDPPIALDPQARAGMAFGVSSIPHSVVIDKKGVVRKVHIGLAPGLDQTLRQEIEELLAE
jgi:thiol-disulfide isomerase/thioredoxin